MGRLHNSIRRGEGNAYGFLGEIVLAKAIGATIQNTFDYDLVVGKFKIDVKTKACTSEPQPDYDCSVAAFNIKQACDYYMFVRILEDFSKVWLLGKKKKEDYYKEARFCEKGEIDELSTFDWRFKADCYNLSISALEPIKFREN